MKQVYSCALFLLCLIFLGATLGAEAGTCKPSGKLRGKKPPPGLCNKLDDSVAPWKEGCDGGAPSECDNQYYSDDEPVVALSTGWYNKGSRCMKYINIHGNGRTVKAKVVDECDSSMGCDADHDYQPPCPYNIVDASKAVWKALGVPERDWGERDIHWSDA